MSDWDYVRLMNVRFLRRAFVTGFPGSGNVVLRRLCDEAIAASGDSDGGRDAREVVAIGALRATKLLDTMKSCLPKDWNGDAYLSSHRGGALSDFFAVGQMGHFLCLSAFETNLYMNAGHATHELPCRSNYDLFEASGISVLSIVRHPLDVLNSLAGKTPVDEEQDENSNRASFQSLAKRRAAIRTNNEVWLKLAGHTLARFLNALAELKDRWPVLKYEDLMTDPNAFVESLVARLGLDSIPASAKEQMRSMAGQSEFAPMHFNAPGTNKWKGKFSPQQINILTETGVFDAAEKFGYERPHVTDFGEDRATSYAIDRNPQMFLQTSIFSQTFDPALVSNLSGDAVSIYSNNVGHCRCFSTDKTLLNGFCKRLAERARQHAL